MLGADLTPQMRTTFTVGGLQLAMAVIFLRLASQVGI